MIRREPTRVPTRISWSTVQPVHAALQPVGSRSSHVLDGVEFGGQNRHSVRCVRCFRCSQFNNLPTRFSGGKVVGYPIVSDPKEKSFRLRADQIRPGATGYGGCIATDLITCGGRKVGFMYREATRRDVDSGWRFMSGYESDEYMNDPANHAVYDVNTIANYDSDIIPFLDAPVGSVFERENGSGQFVEVHDFESPED